TAAASLAWFVPRTVLLPGEPINGIDVDPLRPYVAALDAPAFPKAPLAWTSARSAHVNTSLAANQVVSIQIAWHAGWRAKLNGRAEPILRDGIGLMYLDPHIDGPAKIDLVYDGGREMKIARWICALTALSLAIAALIPGRMFEPSP